jgi:hypothetical protein
VGVTGNLTFTGTGNRITGDFSNGTVASRAMFQTSTTNGATNVSAIPNGTSVVASIACFDNSDTTNAAFGQLRIQNATDVRINSSITGTGTYLPMTFYTGGSESLRLSATTKAVILAGGSTSANGTGITFPATQSASSDANTLDDYEEGTFTPIIKSETGSFTSVSYSDATGTYTKIGRVVSFNALVGWSSFVVGTATGTLQVGNLPFTSADSDTTFAAITYKINWPNAGSIAGQVTGTSINFRISSSDGDWNLVQVSAQSAAEQNYIRVSGCYRV